MYHVPTVHRNAATAPAASGTRKRFQKASDALSW